jgi:hypothetical protein
VDPYRLEAKGQYRKSFLDGIIKMLYFFPFCFLFLQIKKKKKIEKKIVYGSDEGGRVGGTQPRPQTAQRLCAV